MKKPINQATMARLVSNIRSNIEAFDKGDSISTDYAERVMNALNQIMRDGHVMYVSIWPQNGITQVWDVCVDGVDLCKGGVLYDETAVPKLLKRERS